MPGDTFLISGFYFQNQERLTLTTIAVEGVVAMMSGTVVRDMFSGMIWSQEAGLTGEMRDGWGSSRLADVTLEGDELSYNKHYHDRDDIIRYQFRREGDIYVGRFEGDVVGTGAATCVLVPVNERLLQPPATTA